MRPTPQSTPCRTVSLLVLACAPLLGGCTLVMKGASDLREANVAHEARFPVDPESLRPGERVRVEARQSPPVVGRWAGISQAGTGRAYVLVVHDVNTVIPLSQRPFVYRMPSPSNATAFVLAGLALDAAFSVIVIRELRGLPRRD